MNHYWTSSYKSGKYAGLSASGKTKKHARKNLDAKVKRREAAEMQLSYEQWEAVYGIIDMMYSCPFDKGCYFHDNQWGISNEEQLDSLMRKIRLNIRNAERSSK